MPTRTPAILPTPPRASWWCMTSVVCRHSPQNCWPPTPRPIRPCRPVMASSWKAPSRPSARASRNRPRPMACIVSCMVCSGRCYSPARTGILPPRPCMSSSSACYRMFWARWAACSRHRPPCWSTARWKGTTGISAAWAWPCHWRICCRCRWPHAEPLMIFGGCRDRALTNQGRIGLCVRHFLLVAALLQVVEVALVAPAVAIALQALVEACEQRRAAFQAFRQHQVAEVDQQGLGVVGDLGPIGGVEVVAQGGIAHVDFLRIEHHPLPEQLLEVLHIAGNPLHLHLVLGEKGIEGRAVTVFQAAAEGHAGKVVKALPVEGQAFQVKEHELLVEQRRAEEKSRLALGLVHPHRAGVETPRRGGRIGAGPGQKLEP